MSHTCLSWRASTMCPKIHAFNFLSLPLVFVHSFLLVFVHFLLACLLLRGFCEVEWARAILEMGIDRKETDVNNINF